MFLKGLHKWLASIALLAVIVSFSGFTYYPSSYHKTQTELVINNTSSHQATSKSFSFLKRSSQNITFNQYTTFCFKWLLNTHQYNFSITLKSQKEAILQFNKQMFLEQNLIAQIFSDDYQSNLIK